ncbi:SpoIIE family protein phosphatase [Streptomyces sp. NPDC017979]|uniref:SpoIIE family protein phosphatase n=1 Tax=Streptomyces sp. NPDC017979 TaxID=3365024 RepID=UPI00378F0E76
MAAGDVGSDGGRRGAGSDGGSGSGTDADRVREGIIRLLNSPDPQSLLVTVLELGLAGAGAYGGSVFVADEDGWLRLAGYLGTNEEVLRRFPAIAPDSSLPLAVAVREQRPVHGVSDDLVERYPDLAGLQEEVHFLVMPLLVDDRCLGGLVVQYDRPGAPAPDDHRLLTMVTEVCAHRLEHLLMREGAERAATTFEPEAAASTGAQADAPTGPKGIAGPKDIADPTDVADPSAVADPAAVDPADVQRRSQSRRTRLELAMSSGDIGSFEWDIPSGIVIADERTIRLFGFDPDRFDSLVSTFLGAVHPDDLDELLVTIERSKREGAHHAVHRVVWPDGSVRWLESKGSIEYAPDGEPALMVGVVWDCTAQRERVSRREARREFVLKVTNSFAAALSTRDVLDTMTGTVLPELGATALAIHIEQEGRLLLAGAAGYPESTLSRLRLIGTVANNPMSEALRAGHPLFFGSREEYLERFPDPRLRPTDSHGAFVFLPLASADGTVGTCLISYDRPRRFTHDDQIITAAIAGILTQSLARSRLSDLFRRRMTDLQELMMPRALPRLPGFEIAARYLPAAEGMQVGGDWFDLLPREDGGASLVIGDVEGHSAQAAGVMGQLRTALRAHAYDGYRAEHLMARGNHTLWGLDTDRFATCCIVDVSPRAGHLQVVRAGHPSPLQAEPDGTVHELPTPGALPLGYAPADRYPVYHGQLQPGAALLLYTDGLVDTPDRPYDEAVAAVSAELSQWMTRPQHGSTDRQGDLEALADGLVSSGRAANGSTHPGYDDVAVLLVRRTSWETGPVRMVR